MKKKRKRYTKKSVYKAASFTLGLLLLVGISTYMITHTEWESPKMNEISASYISLNNNNTTDMLKIKNLKKLTDTKGLRSTNQCVKEFQITGTRDSNYRIVLYHLGDIIEEEYVKFDLKNDKNIEIKGILKNQPQTFDGGSILFEGTMEEGKNWTLKMWVDKEYDKDVKNVAYEIRIRD